MVPVTCFNTSPHSISRSCAENVEEAEGEAQQSGMPYLGLALRAEGLTTLVAATSSSESREEAKTESGKYRGQVACCLAQVVGATAETAPALDSAQDLVKERGGPSTVKLSPTDPTDFRAPLEELIK